MDDVIEYKRSIRGSRKLGPQYPIRPNDICLELIGDVFGKNETEEQAMTLVAYYQSINAQSWHPVSESGYLDWCFKNRKATELNLLFDRKLLLYSDGKIEVTHEFVAWLFATSPSRDDEVTNPI